MSRDRIALVAAAIGVTALLWLADSGIRASLTGLSTLQLFLVPPADAVLTRISLFALAFLAAVTADGYRRLRLAREETLEEREHIMLLYESATDAIVFLDHDLRIIYANPAAERLSGKRMSEMVGWPCHEAILGTDGPCDGCKAREVFETGEGAERLKHEVTATGQENWLEQRWFPVLGKGGHVDAVLEIARDTTDLKLLQREVIACHKDCDERRRVSRETERADAGVS